MISFVCSVGFGLSVRVLNDYVLATAYIYLSRILVATVKYWSFNEHNSYNYIEHMADTISITSESYVTTRERATQAPRLHAGVNTPQQ